MIDLISKRYVPSIWVLLRISDEAKKVLISVKGKLKHEQNRLDSVSSVLSHHGTRGIDSPRKN